SLTSIDLPSSVKLIGESAFSGCACLTSLVIPSSVTEVKRSAFYGCDSLNSGRVS
ncbi:MAG: leucine-rich repeat domain-containing protein, partial [Bacteroidaceae bacterium]|nr:leucine-rich repeat domain-containing protein [Bacteroidaceae bacterium]